MGSPQLWLHLCFVVILSPYTNFSYAHRASLISTTPIQARSSVPVDGGNQAHIRRLNEPLAPYWVLDHQCGGWEANELDPDWNPPVENVGKVPKLLVENDINKSMLGKLVNRGLVFCGKKGIQGK